MLTRADVVVNVLDSHFREPKEGRDSDYNHDRCYCGEVSGWLEAHIAEKVLDALDEWESGEEV